MNAFYKVQAVATIKLVGTASILDGHGKTVRCEDLSKVDAFEVKTETILPIPEHGQCGIQFTLADIFGPFNT